MVEVARPFVAIVEDYEDSRDVFVECLRIGGFDAAGFACAEDALASFASRRPDAVVTDLTLPGMSGEQFALRLKKEPGLATVPLFALSGRALEARVSTLFVRTLQKPVDLESLTAELKRTLRAHDTVDA
jgi:CheY-like chemotaxis protein